MKRRDGPAQPGFSQRNIRPRSHPTNPLGNVRSHITRKRPETPWSSHGAAAPEPMPGPLPIPSPPPVRGECRGGHPGLVGEKLLPQLTERGMSTMTRPTGPAIDIGQRHRPWSLLAAGLCATVVVGCHTPSRPTATAAAPTTTVGPTTTTTPPITYVIKAGDTLSAMAKRFGITLAALAGANHIANPDTIKQGQILTIPPAPPPTTTTAPPTTAVPSPPRLAVTPPDGPVGTVFNLNLTGARPTENVTFQIVGPTGTKFTGSPHTIGPSSAVATVYVTTQADQPGKYTIVVTGDQGTTATAAFAVDPTASSANR